MNEMYWITRLYGLQVIFVILITVILFILMFMGIYYFLEVKDMNDKEKDKIIKKWNKPTKTFLIIGIISIFGLVFIPSEKDIYKIIGIGGTYDYLKNNEKAKQIPDKVIDCLDKLLDTENKKEK